MAPEAPETESSTAYFSQEPSSCSMKIVDYSSDEDESAPNPHIQFEEMGFEHSEIEAALRACGARAANSDLIDYMFALRHAPDPLAVHVDSINGPEGGSVSDENNEMGLISPCLEVEPQDQMPKEEELRRVLQTMEFPNDAINAALESCGAESSVEILIAFILQHAPGTSGAKNEELSTVAILQDMGYTEESALKAIGVCGSDDIDILVDFMDAQCFEDSQDEEDDEFPQYEFSDEEASNPKKRRRHIKELTDYTEYKISKSDLKGFGLPGEPFIPRTLTMEQARRPFFYFENVRSMPRGEWDNITRFLYNIKPEFVCARHFSVTRRPRGYVHNLPLENRTPLLPIPPKTIREFLPGTVRYTPPWDTRTQLHCINTMGHAASICAKVEGMIRTGKSGGALPDHAKEEILNLLKKWNLVWTGPEMCSSLEAHEIERALGYDEYHTRGAIAINKRNKALGNSFQVDVVGFHLSALRPLFPNGIRVLSLFSGIGGAEVALHKAGIPLRYVVSVEAEECSRKILERWWITSGQKGKHRILNDVQELTRSKLEELMREAGGGFDLLIGGSPCNNVSGNNRCSRTGLEGEHSSLFYEFPRILNLIRGLPAR